MQLGGATIHKPEKYSKRKIETVCCLVNRIVIF